MSIGGPRRIRAACAAFGLVATSLVAGHAAAAPSGGALSFASTLELQIAGDFGVPADAEMVALHVGVARAAGSGHISLWPCDPNPPNTSIVNYGESQLTQSLVLAKLSDRGTVCVAAHETTDVIIDLAGFVPVGSDLQSLPGPVRILNTRGEQRVRAGEVLTVPIAGTNGVAPDAAAAAFTVTAFQGLQAGHLTAFPCGQPVPRTSTVNWPAGKAVPNFVMAKLGDGGAVCLVASTDVHVIVDLVAWIPDGATGFRFLDRPNRTFDTRFGTGTAARPFVGGESREVPVAAPSDAIAVIGNLTAARQPRAGFATMYPCGEGVPRAASLNWSGAPGVANASIAKLGAGGNPCVNAAFPTDLLYDVSGFVTSESFYTPLSPVRVHDSRRGWEAACPFVPILLGDGRIALYEADGRHSDDVRLRLPDGFFATEPRLLLQSDCSTVWFEGEDWREDNGDVGVGGLDVRSGTVEWYPTFDYAAEPIEVEGTIMLFGSRTVFVDPDEGESGREFGLFDLETQTLQEPLPSLHGDGGTHGTVSTDGRYISYIVSDVDGPVLRTVDRRHASVNDFSFPFHTELHELSYGPDTDLLAVSGFEVLPGSIDRVRTVRVVGTDGSLVETVWSTEGQLTGYFVGRGEVLICADGAVARLELFGDLFVLEDADRPGELATCPA